MYLKIIYRNSNGKYFRRVLAQTQKTKRKKSQQQAFNSISLIFIIIIIFVISFKISYKR